MYPLCNVDDIQEGESKGFEIRDHSLFVVKKYGEVFAYVNSCPHIGVALEWLPDQFLDGEGELIQCSTHGALFVIETGVCVAGPCIGEALQPLAISVLGEILFVSDVFTD